MTVDIILQASNQFAAWQWLDARGLGTLTQDAETGVWSYRHDPPGAFGPWLGTGAMVMSRTQTGTDADGLPIYAVTFASGWWGMLRIDGDVPPDSVQTWCRTFAAGIVLEGFSAVAGDGVALVRPEDVQAHMDSIGLPRHGWFGGDVWSDPQAWALLGPAMTGDVREFGGVEWRSLIDVNVWSPTTLPTGWEIVDAGGGIEAWVQPTGAHDAYAQGARVTHEGSTWTSDIADNTYEPGAYGWTEET